MIEDHAAPADTAVWSVADRYLVGPCIGRGGMAEVYEGLDTRLARSVAVKILRAEYAGDAARRRGLSAEARAAARLSHPNVATVYDVGEDEGRPCIVMELVNGGSLARRLEDPPMGQEEAVRLITQVLAALDAAHRAGIVHRDIKPGNILLTEDGNAKVTDFGIAKALEPAPADVDLTVTGEVMGTPRYLAPERAAGEQATVASDVWAVGVVLYEALTGRPPFEADTPLGLAIAAERGDLVPPEVYRPDLSPALGLVVARALAPRPLDRFTSASEMAASLSRAVTDPAQTDVFEPPTAPYPDLSGVTGQRRPPPRRALLVGGGVALTLLLVAVAALLLLKGGRSPTAAAAPPPSSTAPPSTVPLTTLPPATTTTPPPPTTMPTTRVPATIATTPTSSIGCSVLRAEHQALAQQQAQFDKAEKSRAGRAAADRAFASRQHAIEQAMRQLCG